MRRAALEDEGVAPRHLKEVELPISVEVEDLGRAASQR